MKNYHNNNIIINIKRDNNKWLVKFEKKKV